ncbi:uncharacterized protein C2845_PM07G26740 [Panicum miliaceum]|uniref:Uncharacterized protein n=1 Tax=Panicum miliaceum TaxID=4540 RepID=A0A3L6SK23_PANMI|nr:uncharacterized protein C2845_PM07G26740 [Panicum miliaceum]
MRPHRAEPPYPRDGAPPYLQHHVILRITLHSLEQGQSNRAQAQGIQVPMCFCGSLCKMMESQVLGDDFGMRFFMCENYEYDPPKRYGKERPKWLDTEQSQEAKEQVEWQARWAAERWQRMLHEEKMEEKGKKDREEIRKRIEEAERQEAKERYET